MKIKASINVKINSIIILSLLLMGAATITLSYISLNRMGLDEIDTYRNALMEEKKEMLKYLVASAHHLAENNYREDNSPESKNKTLDVINSFRYGKDSSDYLYSVDTKARVMLQHPNKDLIGKKDTYFKDPDGKQQIVAQIDLALEKGEGFDSYKWKKVGEQEPQPKLSYVKYFRDWNMAIVTGIYTDDIEKEVSRKKKVISTHIRNQIIRQTLVLVALIIGAVFIAYVVVYGGIVKPIRRMIDMLKDIAQGEGDLTKRIHDDSGDETEEMANWFNTFIEQVQTIIKDVSTNAATLKVSSGELSALSNDMSNNAAQTSDKSNTVAAAGEEMSSNMQSVAASMEEASTNVNMVASATEEMSATINEIAENTESARQITGNAVSKTTSASDQVGELGKAAKEIGKVVEAITDISGQVDLLALNATIEAARAGDAGKGFAVVANEIKELARQTAEATMEIKNRVESIQLTTDGTVKEINEVSAVVNDIDSIVSTIATAVEQQTATTNEIVDNVSQASIGLSEVNENVAQSSSVSAEIAQEIAEVNSAARDISESCTSVNKKAQELTSLANNLNEMVKKFKV